MCAGGRDTPRLWPFAPPAFGDSPGAAKRMGRWGCALSVGTHCSVGNSRQRVVWTESAETVFRTGTAAVEHRSRTLRPLWPTLRGTRAVRTRRPLRDCQHTQAVAPSPARFGLLPRTDPAWSRGSRRRGTARRARAAGHRRRRRRKWR